MYSVISQEKTPLRDSRGGSIYRRSYLCDGQTDVPGLPTEDAPGSLCYVAESGESYVLDHRRTWHPCPKGGMVWHV